MRAAAGATVAAGAGHRLLGCDGPGDDGLLGGTGCGVLVRSGGPLTEGGATRTAPGIVNLHGRPVALARGKSGTVVIFLATWSLYGAYLDRYSKPVLARTPGMVMDMIDTDVGSGIAHARSLSPAFGGLDQGLPGTTSQEERTMTAYAHRFGLNSVRNAPLHGAPAAAPHVGAPRQCPTLIAGDPAGDVLDVHCGPGDWS